MIRNKKELKEAISADRMRYELRNPMILGWLLGDESYVVVRYLKILRKLEYYTNTKHGFLSSLKYYYYLIRHRRNQITTGIFISPNTVGKGLYIPHFGGGIILSCTKMGENCVAQSGVVLGKKGANEKPIIGNNVYLTVGSKVIGGVTIGDNVIVAPNSVVVKDIPDNAVVSGIPAKVLKYRE